MRTAMLATAFLLVACSEDRKSAEQTRQSARGAAHTYSQAVAAAPLTHAVQGATQGLMRPAFDDLARDSLRRGQAISERMKNLHYAMAPIDITNEDTEFSRSAVAELKRPGTSWVCVAGVVMHRRSAAAFEQVTHDGRTLVCPRPAGVYDLKR